MTNSRKSVRLRSAAKKAASLPLDCEIYRLRLLKDSRAVSSFDKLRKYGAADPDIAKMIETFAGIPLLWAGLKKETASEASSRRSRLVKQIRDLADAVRLDRDTKHAAVRDVLELPASGETLVWAMLERFADLLSFEQSESTLLTSANASDVNAAKLAQFFGGAKRRISEEVFAFRFVFSHVVHFWRGRSRPMKVTADIVSGTCQ